MDLFDNLKIAFFKAKYELEADNSKHFFGLSWVFIEPMIYIFALYIVFGQLLNRGGPDFIIFLSAGLGVWLFLSKNLSSSSSLLIQNRSFLESFKMSHNILFLSNIIKHTARSIPLFHINIYTFEVFIT